MNFIIYNCLNRHLSFRLTSFFYFTYTSTDLSDEHSTKQKKNVAAVTAASGRCVSLPISTALAWISDRKKRVL